MSGWNGEVQVRWVGMLIIDRVGSRVRGGLECGAQKRKPVNGDKRFNMASTTTIWSWVIAIRVWCWVDMLIIGRVSSF